MPRSLSPEPAVLVTFARPEESGPFRRRIHGATLAPCGSLKVTSGTVAATPVHVVHTGIGPQAAAASMREVLPFQRWQRVIAAGFAGALDPELALGDVVVQSFPAPTPPALISVSEPIETVRAKATAFSETRARTVDMESASIATACIEAGLPLVAVRCISDPATVELPVPFDIWFDLPRQRPKPFMLCAWLLAHPRRILPFIRFLSGLKYVRIALADAVEAELRTSTR